MFNDDVLAMLNGQLAATQDTRAEPGATAPDAITAIYEKFSTIPGFRERPGQLDLSRHVQQVALEGGVLVAEAPTGTGKTLGYLAGAIAAHRQSNLPVVVATATVALQAQILNADVPSLIKSGVVRPGEVVLMKGRGRYFCPRQAEGFEREKAARQTDMFAEEGDAEPDLHVAIEMLDAFRAKEWSGDVDEWPGKRPVIWAKVQASGDTCTKKQCPHYEQCPFFDARAKAAGAAVIVANHSIVLSDLAMRAQEADGLFPAERYLVVFDEAHKLPDIATESAAHKIYLEQPWLEQVEDFVEKVSSLGPVARMIDGGEIEGTLSTDALTLSLERLAEICNEIDVEDGAWVRFPGGKLDTKLRNALVATYQGAEGLMKGLYGINKALSKMADGSKGGKPDLALTGLMAYGIGLSAQVNALGKGLFAMAAEKHPVAWLGKTEDQIHLGTMPMEGAEVLENLLWSAGMPVVLVSATLKALGSFDNYKRKAGIPAMAKFIELDYVLPYGDSELVLTNIQALTPGREDYDVNLVQELATRIEAKEGTLVLFTNKETMKRVATRLPMDLRREVLMQFTRPVAELVREHKRRIDAGHGSVLFGVDSFSEGLDLPGAYCSHVIITKLPFASPGSPLEEARQEEDPQGYFRNVMLAEAGVKLVQSAGRLVRRETDSGKITILDPRMRSKNYGSKLLASLPPFKVVREQPKLLESPKIKAVEWEIA